jgi:hypothetical protein
MTKKLAKSIAKNAEIINMLFSTMKETAKQQDVNFEKNQQWQQACREYLGSYDVLAFPGGMSYGLQMLKAQNPTTVAISIEYLMVNPYFHRSGYLKQMIVRLLKKIMLTDEQKEALRDYFLSTFLNTHRRWRKDFYSLAVKIVDDTFRARLEELIAKSENHILVKNGQALQKYLIPRV